MNMKRQRAVLCLFLSLSLFSIVVNGHQGAFFISCAFDLQRQQ